MFTVEGSTGVFCSQQDGWASTSAVRSALFSQILSIPEEGAPTATLGDLSHCCTTVLLEDLFLMSSATFPSHNSCACCPLLGRVWLHHLCDSPSGGCSCLRFTLSLRFPRLNNPSSPCSPDALDPSSAQVFFSGPFLISQHPS